MGQIRNIPKIGYFAPNMPYPAPPLIETKAAPIRKITTTNEFIFQLIFLFLFLLINIIYIAYVIKRKFGF